MIPLKNAPPGRRARRSFHPSLAASAALLRWYKSINRYSPLAVGLIEIENIIRYAPRAVGLKPSAIQGEARLRGLDRNNSSKTISPRLSKAKPACAGYTGLFLQRPLALGYARQSPPARARAE